MKAFTLLLAAALLVTIEAAIGDGKCRFGVLKRKEWSTLSSDEKRLYVDSLKRVQARPSSNQPSFYDSLVKTHMDHAPEIHGTPRFLPWHRYYLSYLENELQNKSGQPVTIPFWDWTKDSQAPEMSKIFNDDVVHFGQSVDNRGCVNSGAFAGYQAFYPTPHCLTRRWDGKSKMGAFTSTDVFEKILTNAKSYDEARIQIEGPHGSVHVSIGGDMGVMNSPNDPIFYLHHANVDRLWNRWQVLHPDLANTYNGPGANPNDVLSPYPAKVSDVYDTTKLCFQYRHFGKNGQTDSGEITPPVMAPPPKPDSGVLGSVGKIGSRAPPETQLPDPFDRSDLFKLRAPVPLPEEWIRMNNMDPNTVRRCEQTIKETVIGCNQDLSQFSTAVLWNNDEILQRLLLLHAQNGEDFQITVGTTKVDVHVDPSGDKWLVAFREQIKRVLQMIAMGAA